MCKSYEKRQRIHKGPVRHLKEESRKHHTISVNVQFFGTCNIDFLEELLNKIMTLMTTQPDQQGFGYILYPVPMHPC